MPTLEEAIRIAAQFHEGQKDKSGEPYILHIIRVIASCKTEKERIVAALHDLIEDTNVTIGDLHYKFRFSLEITNAVLAITHLEDESHDEYIRRCGKNTLAAKVKWYDMQDNSLPERSQKLDIETQKRLKAKYERAKKILIEECSLEIDET